MIGEPVHGVLKGAIAHPAYSEGTVFLVGRIYDTDGTRFSEGEFIHTASVRWFENDVAVTADGLRYRVEYLEQRDPGDENDSEGAA